MAIERNIFRALFLTLAVGLLQSCTAGGSQSVKAIVDQLAFDESAESREEGCMEIRATIDIDPSLFVKSNASLIYKKKTSEAAPDC